MRAVRYGAGLVLAAACAALMAPLAISENAAPNAPLTSEDIQKEFFGTRMYGVQIGTGLEFIECIEPNGRSIFQIEGYTSEGFLEVSADAHACFTYDSGTYCYRVQRAPGGYMIRAAGFRTTFRVNRIEEGVQSCTADDLIG